MNSSNNRKDGGAYRRYKTMVPLNCKPGERPLQSPPEKEEEKVMGYFRECPDCGVHLDPGERCDCGIKGDGQYRQHPDAPIAARRGYENNTEVNDHEEKKMPHDGW